MSFVIEVAYATKEEQVLVELDVREGTTVLDAIERSGILEEHPQIQLKPGFVGIWHKACDFDRAVQKGDRIEIYRGLLADPKEMRRRRAQKLKNKHKNNSKG